MITVIETQQFLSKAKALVGEAEKDRMIQFIAHHPEAGDVIPRTGGVRKLRFAGKGRGKSGGYRVVYYFYDDKNAILLFTVYGKNEKANLTADEEKALYKIVQQIKKEMKDDQ